MMAKTRSILALLFGIILLLAACGITPRGAGVQSEVLAKSNEVVDGSKTEISPGIPTEFAVEVINKDSLGRYAGWPGESRRQHDWISRVDQPNTRLIRSGDMVAVSIWSTEENGLLTAPNQKFVTLPSTQVSPNGQVFLPYIGQKKVSGMSLEKARRVIEEAYLGVSPSAQVQIALTEGRMSTVSIVGGVARPGAFPLVDQDMTILDVIALSGGVAPSLNNPQIKLQRADKTYANSMDRLLNDPNLNTTLQGGDRLHVEEDSRYFLSLGATGKRAQHKFQQDRVTALDALSIIGGLEAARANARGILILRRYNDDAVRQDGSGPRHARTIFTIDMTSADGLFSAGEFQILPNDLIYVTESPFLGTRNIFGLIRSVFGLANQAGSL